jgi:lipid A 3-O-deacylase
MTTALALACATNVLAADFRPTGISFEYGESDSANADVNLYRVGLQWDWKKQWLNTGNWSLGGYWYLGLGYWDFRTVAALRTNDNITDIGFTPVFRFQQNNPRGLSPYVEAGVGIHFLSATSVSTQRSFGSSFQFGDHIGAGLRLGDKGQFDVGYRYQHLSNAGIKQPNQGINFHQVRLQYNF